MEMYSQNALIFKAFCDEVRLQIIELLTQKEMCACNLIEQLPIGQSTLSHHMKILVESGIVIARKEGKWVYYTLSERGIDAARGLLVAITTRKVDYESTDCCTK